MTTPPHCLRTNHRYTLLRREFKQFSNAILELFSLHVIRVTAKLRVAPRGVVRIRSRRSPTSETRLMAIVNAKRLELLSESLSIELRITTRTRVCPHIN